MTLDAYIICLESAAAFPVEVIINEYIHMQTSTKMETVLSFFKERHWEKEIGKRKIGGHRRSQQFI